ncbi:MAG: S8 family serine peptidase [Bdellovibrionales bacterium]|nr:S8 family serine peptidase [Bdellovibrionales bacterium]
MKITSLLFIILASTQVSAAEYIIKQKNINLKSVSQIAGVTALETHKPGNLVLVDIADAIEASVLSKIYQDPNVEYVVENIQLHTVEAPLDFGSFANLQEQWANQKVNIEKAWQVAGRGSKDVLLAIIDTGVDYRHESLSTNMVPGYDFKGNDNDPMDETGSQNAGHGTHCAGSIGANGLVDGGTVGASPNISIMPLRFLGADGSGDLMAGIKAIDYAIEHKAAIISASWGAKVNRSQAQPLVDAVERADKAGVIFVAAAANNGTNNDTTEFYPANGGFPNMIAVAASDINDAKPSWSNFGKKTVHIASPGLDILSTFPGNKYGKISGTSMATPLVAGIVALIKSQYPNMTGAEIRAILQSTGAKVEIETACNCRIDAAAAVTDLKAEKMFLVPTATALKPQETLQVSVKNGQAPFSFTSSNTNIATISAEGLVSAVAEGTTRISVKDAAGTTVTSLDYVVANASTGGGGGECPLGDPSLCELLCGIMPDLPFCSK